MLDLADSKYAARGWNQPFQLLAIAPLTARPKKSRDALSPKATAEGVSFDPDTAVTVAQVPVPAAGTLIELIGGARVPAWVDALILTAEAWSSPASSGDEMDPTAGLAPSAHPGRVEVRTTIAVARDGYTLKLGSRSRRGVRAG